VKNLHLEDGEGGGRIKLIYGVDWAGSGSRPIAGGVEPSDSSARELVS
jgi:hypothetical protein